ncbi:hypothetical protein MMC09_000866 [Bachmanniomyces sp. S44760]|nr:hypothetical protein [Bachmanniomyces sp. S44760]
MPRIIRHQTLAQRLKAYLNPLDILLWISEELESSDWEQWGKEWAIPIGVGLNIVMLIARANARKGGRNTDDDVFGDTSNGSGWFSWLAAFIVHFLTLLSFLNAAYTFYRQRHYRLFEASVDAPPSTPSVHRVRVDSSPLSSSPLRFFSELMNNNAAQARAHPDAKRDVWELSVWDPNPLSLRLFCLFSPGHTLVYWLFLPYSPQDPRPSTTIATTIVLSALLSAQLMLLQSSFSQQSKDISIVNKEVLNEYDTKFVHPRTQPQVRDVGTQFTTLRRSSHGTPGTENEHNTVDTYTPTVIINRGFHTHPNPNFVNHVDPGGLQKEYTPSRALASNTSFPIQTPTHLRDMSSPIRPQTAIRQPHFRGTGGTGGGDGGSLGVYSHANSPLKKSTTAQFGASRKEGERSVSPAKRQGSPLKRSNVPGVMNGVPLAQRFGHLREPGGARNERGRF